MSFALFTIFFFVIKTHNLARFPFIKLCPYNLALKWCAPVYLSKHHGGMLMFGSFVFVLWHLVHQTRHYLINRKFFFYWHCFQDGDQIFVQCQQALEQGHDDIYVFYGYLYANKMIHKRHYLGNVVQQILIILDFAREKLTKNKKNVRLLFFVF